MTRMMKAREQGTLAAFPMAESQVSTTGEERQGEKAELGAKSRALGRAKEEADKKATANATEKATAHGIKPSGLPKAHRR